MVTECTDPHPLRAKMIVFTHSTNLTRMDMLSNFIVLSREIKQTACLILIDSANFLLEGICYIEGGSLMMNDIQWSQNALIPKL